MRRPIVYSPLVLAGSFLLTSCAEKSPKLPDGPPQIHFPVSTQELGEIPIAPEGRKIAFSFVNRGLSELRVSQLTSSCACAAAEIDKPLLAPGEAGKIIVVIAPRQSEERSAALSVHSNDPLAPVLPLKVSWRAVAPLEFDPLSVDFGTVLPGEAVQRKIGLIRHGKQGKACRLERIESFPTETIRAAFEEETDAENPVDNQQLLVLLTAGTDSGAQSGRINVFFSECWRESLTIPVRWEVQDTIEATPARLFLGSGAAGELRRQNLLVSTHRDEELQIKQIEFAEAVPSAEVTWKQLSPGRILARVEWTLPSREGHHTLELLVHCLQPEQRILRLPVSAYVIESRNPRAGGDDS